MIYVFLVTVLILVINIFLMLLNLKYIDYFEEILNTLEKTDQNENYHYDEDKSGKELFSRLHEFQKMKFSKIQSSKREKK